jgi:hypothetical protein
VTAVYQLTAELPAGLVAKAIWNSKFHEQVTCYLVASGQVTHKLVVADLAEADEWAAAQGVKRWQLAKSIRVAPFAARLPIDFPDAPAPPILAAALERVAAGASVERIAVELGADPILARAWLRGYDPACSATQRLDVPGLRNEDIWSGTL